jgi:hypothetical protein
MDQLINSLPALLLAAGNAEEATEAAALAVWNHVAGEGLRQHTAATSHQKQKMTVVVSDSLWQHQLESMSGQFLFRLNALLGQGTIRFIEFRVDPKTLQTYLDRRPQIENILQDNQSASQPVPFELISAAASIRDPSLRRAFLGAASSCVRRREAIQQTD